MGTRLFHRCTSGSFAGFFRHRRGSGGNSQDSILSLFDFVPCHIAGSFAPEIMTILHEELRGEVAE
jgi:hypothetical protein